MVRGIEANILRNDDGFPMQVNLKKGPQKLTIDYPSDQNNFIIKGDEDLLPVLNQIYPFTATPKLTIPQPLQTVSVQGGDTLLFDDMEGLLKWTESTATVALDNTNAYNGSQSLKLTAAAGSFPVAGRYFPPSKSGKQTFSCLWAVDDWTKIDYVQFAMSYQTNTDNVTGLIQFDRANLYWTYRDPAGNQVKIPDSDIGVLYKTLSGVGGQYNFVKFTFDYVNATLYNFQFNELLLKPIVLARRTIAASARRNDVFIGVDAAAASAANMYIDDVLIVEA